jgi:mRNA interferase MazF
MIAPMTTRSHEYPSRVALRFEGKHSWIVFDQIRTVDRARLIKELGTLDARHIRKVKDVIKEMLVE